MLRLWKYRLQTFSAQAKLQQFVGKFPQSESLLQTTSRPLWTCDLKLKAGEPGVHCFNWEKSCSAGVLVCCTGNDVLRD